MLPAQGLVNLHPPHGPRRDHWLQHSELRPPVPHLPGPDSQGRAGGGEACPGAQSGRPLCASPRPLPGGRLLKGPSAQCACSPPPPKAPEASLKSPFTLSCPCSKSRKLLRCLQRQGGHLWLSKKRLVYLEVQTEACRGTWLCVPGFKICQPKIRKERVP